jgi:hypothetical protein
LAPPHRKVRLDDVLLSLGSHFVYTYDMGDSWEHTIVLEKRLPVDPNLTYPVCFGGERACPPEDIGGIYMFQELLEAFRDPEHERHQEMLEWVGEEWDPDAFSADGNLPKDPESFLAGACPIANPLS